MVSTQALHFQGLLAFHEEAEKVRFNRQHIHSSATCDLCLDPTKHEALILERADVDAWEISFVSSVSASYMKKPRPDGGIHMALSVTLMLHASSSCSWKGWISLHQEYSLTLHISPHFLLSHPIHANHALSSQFLNFGSCFPPQGLWLSLAICLSGGIELIRLVLHILS